jgi:lipoprotein-anchoring transpeptidase ErfK/SrfK
VPNKILSLGYQPHTHLIVVDSRTQTLTLFKNNRIVKEYSISTSKYGLGEKINTFKTPRGLHRVSEKIGHAAPQYAIFHRRQHVGKWTPLPRDQHRKDYVSTRILRLEGLEPGFNRGTDTHGHNIDTEQRAVYIHGTTMEWKLGYPSTKGCVHMHSKDIVHLFNHTPVGTPVWIN